jgi:hypothetical protein
MSCFTTAQILAGRAVLIAIVPRKLSAAELAALTKAARANRMRRRPPPLPARPLRGGTPKPSGRRDVTPPITP